MADRNDLLPVKWWDSPAVIGATIVSVDPRAGEATLTCRDGRAATVDLWTDAVTVVDVLVEPDVDDDAPLRRPSGFCWRCNYVHPRGGECHPDYSGPEL